MKAAPGATLVEVARRLAKAASKLAPTFGPPVAHVYNPLAYAWPMTEAYLTRFGEAPKEVFFLGMNPGPFGMAQTGVPFGDVASVRDWFRLCEPIASRRGIHPGPHPKRPVLGLATTRVEVSGARLWGAVAKRHPDPATFFARAFVWNYCPLLFLDERGANLTPDKLRAPERSSIEAMCDRALGEMLGILRPAHAIGIGLYAKKRLEKVGFESARIACIPHPSPASPAANKDWAGQARTALERDGVVGLL